MRLRVIMIVTLWRCGGGPVVRWAQVRQQAPREERARTAVQRRPGLYRLVLYDFIASDNYELVPTVGVRGIALLHGAGGLAPSASSSTLVY